MPSIPVNNIFNSHLLTFLFSTDRFHKAYTSDSHTDNRSFTIFRIIEMDLTRKFR